MDTPIYAEIVFFAGRETLRFWPPGYESPICLPVIRSGSREAGGVWSWNGSTEKPTLKPSIRTLQPDGRVSHFWLTDGECLFLQDSTDGNAGRALPLQVLPAGPEPERVLLRVGITRREGTELYIEAPKGWRPDEHPDVLVAAAKQVPDFDWDSYGWEKTIEVEGVQEIEAADGFPVYRVPAAKPTENAKENET